MPFRADIEGLRGIAVLLVVFAHAGVPGLAGGFVGVDVFFVISGYLITGVICRELETTGRFDAWGFFARRARRLAPALLAMLALVAAGAALWLPAGSAALHMESAAWAAAWASNIHFSIVRFDYFDPGATESLLLHTWSLGVEEQFYLVWPLLLAWASRHGGLRPAACAAIAAGGFALSLAWLAWEPVSAYYAMPVRLWQLALGAFVQRWTATQVRADRGGAVLGWGGLAGLALGVAVAEPGAPHPGFTALPAALGTAALLAAGVRASGLVPPFLALPALRFPGRLSYSWYLWHWPLLGVPAAMGLPAPPPEVIAAIVLLSFLFAWGSYIGIELPVRRWPIRRPRRWLGALLAASILLVAGCLLGAGRDRAVASAPEMLPDFRALVSRQITAPAIYRTPDCDQWYRSDELVPCERVGGMGERVLVLADSVGVQWLAALEPWAAGRGARLVVLTKSACPMVDEPFVYEQLQRRYVECETWRSRVLDYAEATRPDRIIVGFGRRYPFDVTAWERGTARVLARLAATGAAVDLILPTPALSFHGARCVYAQGRMVDGRPVAEACGEPLDRPDPLSAPLSAALVATPSVRAIDFSDLVCPDGWCAALRNGRIVYSDEQHLNEAFVADVAREVGRRLEQAAPNPLPGRRSTRTEP